MTPTIPQYFRPCSTVRCYSQLWLRTQEGHHLVTRCLFQMPLQGDLATTVVAFGISLLNMCRRSLSPTHTRANKILTGYIFYNVVIWYSLLWACSRQFNFCKSLLGCSCLVFIADATQQTKVWKAFLKSFFRHRNYLKKCIHYSIHMHTHTQAVAGPSPPS